MKRLIGVVMILAISGVGAALEVAPVPAAAGNGLEAFPIEGKVEKILAGPKPENWQPSGMRREDYLDLIEPVIRMAAKWVDDDGAVIDPVLKSEWGQTSPRFAAPAAILLASGRIPEHRELVFKVMDRACERLSAPDSKKNSPDFWMRELVTAYTVLDGIAPGERRAKWRESLAKVIPEQHYKEVDPSGKKLASFHNWCIYSAAGESMREAAGIGGVPGALFGNAFFDRYVEPQFVHFTAYGMYRDPNDPITYDITTRLQLAAALAWGYQGKLAPEISELLRRGGLTTLLFVSPGGFVPYGGRSAQFQYQEGITAALCEFEARRYKETNPTLAGAFKRQAHLSAAALRPYLIESDVPRHIKNHFDINSLHGCDNYGQYSVYSLFAASVIGLAALFADDGIAEAPAPAEIGGYTLYLRGPFHKLFASAAGSYLEYDTAADLHYDATGLGRVLAAGMPFGMLPAMPFAAEPKYKIADHLPGNAHNLAIAPEFRLMDGRLIRLADRTAEGEVQFEELESTPGRVRFVLRRRVGEVTVVESVMIERGLIRLEYEIRGRVLEAALPFPVLADDGLNHAAVEFRDGALLVAMEGKSMQVKANTVPEPAETATNRNGVCRVFRFPFDATQKLTLDMRY
ncbi:MAG: hypothetical protein AB7F32_01750 [Victivallaceae bacterium]